MTCKPAGRLICPSAVIHTAPSFSDTRWRKDGGADGKERAWQVLKTPSQPFGRHPTLNLDLSLL